MPEGVAGASAVNNTQLKSLVQLRELVYVPLRDTERSFVESWFVDAMLNEAYLDLNARLRLYQQVDTGTTTATGTIAYPSDMIEPTALWITDAQSNALELQFVDDKVFNSWARPGNNTPAAYIARVFSQTIETYPALESLAYRLEFIARPAALAQDTDTPTAIHPELEPRLVNYAIAKAKWQEGEVQEGNQYMAMYEAGLPGPPRMTNNVRPARLTLIPEPGPFDA